MIPGEVIEIRLPRDSDEEPSMVLTGRIDRELVLITDGLKIDANELDVLGLLGQQRSRFSSAQIDNQRATIDRLLAHLKAHCPELRGEGKCLHIGGPEDVGVSGAGA